MALPLWSGNIDMFCFSHDSEHQSANDKMILKDKLVKILGEFYDECPEVVNIPETADKIIKLFVDSIRDMEFAIPFPSIFKNL